MGRKTIQAAGLMLALLFVCACGGPEAGTAITAAATETVGTISTPTAGMAATEPAGTPVSTVEELVAAIAPGATIIVPEGGLTLSVPYAEPDVSAYDQDPPELESRYVRWDHGGDYWQMVIHGVDNLTLVGQNGRGELVSLDETAYVLTFEGCDDLTLQGLTAGHEVPGHCTGGVFNIYACSGLTLRDVRLYGCGTEGLTLGEVSGATFENCEIYECTYYLMTLSGCADITFKNTTFRDTGEFHMINLFGSSGILFEDCVFRDNFRDMSYSMGYAFFNGVDSRDITARRCRFENNRFDYFDHGAGVVFEDCSFEGNLFDDAGYFADGLWFPFTDGEAGAEGLPVYNNGGLFVEFEGLTYFRQHKNSDYEQSALWGDFPLKPDARGLLMSIDAAGNLRTVCEDSGRGGIFIYQGPEGIHRFVMSRNVTSELATVQELYTMNLDSSDAKSLGHGTAFAVDDNRGLIIAQTYRGGLEAVHCLTGESRPLAEAYHVPLYYDAARGMLYCEDVSGEWETALCAINVRTGEKRMLITDDMPGAEAILGEAGGRVVYRNLVPEGDAFVWLCFGRYDGTANMLQHSGLVRVNLSEGDFYVYEDFTPENWFAEYEVFSFQEESPFMGNPSYDALEGYWMTSEAGLTPLLSEGDLESIDMVNGAYYGPDDFVDVIQAEIVGRHLYFTKVWGPRDMSADIGWRWGYSRGMGTVYRVDLGGFEWRLEPIYSN